MPHCLIAVPMISWRCRWDEVRTAIAAEKLSVVARNRDLRDAQVVAAVHFGAGNDKLALDSLLDSFVAG